MTKQEYVQYEKRVAKFFADEGIDCLGGDGEPYFSWRRCDCCGSHLGGDRYDCSGYNPTTEEVQDGYSVCSDCVYYAAYGRLDDETMSSIEKDGAE